MSIPKAFRILAVVLVAAFVPATAFATPTTAGAPAAEPQQATRVVRGKNIKLKAAKVGKAKGGRSGKVVRAKLARRAAD